MRAEHLKRWLETTRKKEKEDAEAGEETTERNRGGEAMEATATEASNWVMLVELIQTAFRKGQLAEESTW